MCELTFKSRPDNLKHRKMFHKDLVHKCKNKMEGSCSCGDNNCWFKHDIENYGTKDYNDSENITSCEKVI